MARADRTVALLVWRAVRRGAAIIVAALVVMVAAISAAFSAALSPASGGLDLSTLTANPAIRALYGVPYDISTRGGFTVWRGSTIILLLAGLWGMLTATRVLRGDEDAGRWDLLLAEPLHRATATAIHVAVLAAVCGMIGAAVGVTLIVTGSPANGAVLYGTGVGLLSLTFVALGACASQVFGVRRLAAGVSGAALGAAMVIRMAADASNRAGWLRWTTPFGWVEELQAFAANRLAPLIPLALTPVVLIALTMVLSGRRDVGEGLIRTAETATARPRLLRTPARFAWRQRLGALAGWSAGIAFYGLIIGAITASGSEFIAGNPSAQHLTEQLGITGLSTPAGFVASLAGFVAVGLAIYATSSLGVCHEDEDTGRLDLPYAQALSRTTWLGSQIAAILLAVGVATLVSILSTWIGAVAGNAGVSLHDIAVATLNVMPATALFFGLAVLAFGIRGGLAVPVGAGTAIAMYALTFLGPALRWPDWLLRLSPFQHLGNAPVSPVAWTAVAVISALALVTAGFGFAAYQRRDLA